MKAEAKKVKYPENLYLRIEVFKSGVLYKNLAEKIGVSKLVLSQTVNGHYKGTNIVPKIKQELGID